MSSTISLFKKRFLGGKSQAKSSEEEPGGSSHQLNIGTPTDVKRLHHAEHHGKIIKGLPPDLQSIYESMTTVEERQNPDNETKAQNVIKWMEKEEKNRDCNFIRGDFFSPGSSGLSLSSTDEDEIPASSLSAQPNPSSSSVPHDTQNANETNGQEGCLLLTQEDDNFSHQQTIKSIENFKTCERKQSEINANIDGTVLNDGEATLRRKCTKIYGPRVTRNITEEEILSEMKALCSDRDPLDVYDRDIVLGSGAAGTVFLAKNKQTGQQVAIKIIDLLKQPKKEMILMELKVHFITSGKGPIIRKTYLQ